MVITKTKVYSTNLNDLKISLKIAEDDNSYNAELISTYKQAVSVTEGFINFDIVPTINNLIDYCIQGNCYRLLQPSVSIIGISAVTNNVTTTVTDFNLKKYNQYTDIIFTNYLNADQLLINYSSGYSTIPFDIQRAIQVKCRELFDTGDQYQQSSMQSTRAFERILSPHINLI